MLPCEGASPPDESLTDEQRHIMCFLQQTFAADMRQIGVIPRHVLEAGAKSCAVVSSSGAILDHAYGAEIDAHDLVIRFNDAPTKGYEAAVGSSTGLRFGWHLGKFEKDDSSFDYSDRMPHPTHDQLSAAVTRLYPDFLGFKGKSATSHPTTGFRGMLLALANCGTVDAYEMAPSRAALRAKYSYYSGQERHADGQGNSWHATFQAEHDLWRRLSLTGLDEVQASGKSSYIGWRHTQCNETTAPLPAFRAAAVAGGRSFLGGKQPLSPIVGVPIVS